MSHQKHWIPAYIGLGSNLDGPAGQIKRAFNALAKLPESRLEAMSPCYRNPPMGPADQPDFVNAVAVLLTQLDPGDLLSGLQGIERGAGRSGPSGPRWGPRCIDLDILAYASRVIDREELQIPHPGICERNFVLFPLLDLAPELVIPGCGVVRELAKCVDGSTLHITKE